VRQTKDKNTECGGNPEDPSTEKGVRVKKWRGQFGIVNIATPVSDLTSCLPVVSVLKAGHQKMQSTERAWIKNRQKRCCAKAKKNTKLYLRRNAVKDKAELTGAKEALRILPKHDWGNDKKKKSKQQIIQNANRGKCPIHRGGKITRRDVGVEIRLSETCDWNGR